MVIWATYRPPPNLANEPYKLTLIFIIDFARFYTVSIEGIPLR
jgi:hypothetical protein